MFPSFLAEESVVVAAAEDVVQKTSIISDFFESLGLAGLSTIISALVVFIVCAVAIRVITTLTDKIFARSRHIDETVKRFMRTAIKIALWAIAIVIVAGALGIPTASLVAVISVAGLALSLSVQTILANLFSGVTLLFTRPISVGEYVEVGATAGTVHSVGLFYTTLNTPNGQVVTIPNSSVASSTVVNYGREKLRRAQFVYGTDYDDRTEDVYAALLETASKVDKVLTDPAPGVFISAYKDSTIEYTVNVWCDSGDYWDVVAGMNEKVRECFDRHNVHMSFNHINVHMIDK